jgi:eukaryotic translation initiation factor 2-alpha kinase 4
MKKGLVDATASTTSFDLTMYYDLQNRKQRQEEATRREEERKRREAQELEAQIEQTALNDMLAREEQYRSRKRANSETTEVPFSSDTPLQTFDSYITVDGVRFNSVKLFHPRQGEWGF